VFCLKEVTYWEITKSNQPPPTIFIFLLSRFKNCFLIDFVL